jgi:type III pantothenate kinase
MLLCVDIGNTNIKLGLFTGERMEARWRIATDRSRLADDYAALIGSLFAAVGVLPEQVRGCAISSVVPALTEVFQELAQHAWKVDPLVVGPHSDTGMEIHTDYPAEVGPDLIVNAMAARHLYGTPVIVVGFGTATTFVAVSHAGHFEGVAIAPGLVSAGESLFRATATLPRVALNRPPTAIGKNTIRSLQSGLVFGFAGLVEALVARIQQELGGGARVAATGGLAELIAKESSVFDAVEPELGLIGLRLFYERARGRDL